MSIEKTVTLSKETIRRLLNDDKTIINTHYFRTILKAFHLHANKILVFALNILIYEHINKSEFGTV